MILWLQSPSAVVLGCKKIKSVTASTFSNSICCEVMGLDVMIFCFLMLSFKLAFSLFSFILIKRLFSSSSLFAIRVVSSTYLRLQIFLPAILMPISDSPSLACHKMYSAYKLSKLTVIQPCHTPFPVLNQYVVPCLVLTVAS